MRKWRCLLRIGKPTSPLFGKVRFDLFFCVFMTRSLQGDPGLGLFWTWRCRHCSKRCSRPSPNARSESLWLPALSGRSRLVTSQYALQGWHIYAYRSALNTLRNAASYRLLFSGVGNNYPQWYICGMSACFTKTIYHNTHNSSAGNWCGARGKPGPSPYLWQGSCARGCPRHPADGGKVRRAPSISIAKLVYKSDIYTSLIRSWFQVQPASILTSNAYSLPFSCGKVLLVPGWLCKFISNTWCGRCLSAWSFSVTCIEGSCHSLHYSRTPLGGLLFKLLCWFQSVCWLGWRAH